MAKLSSEEADDAGEETIILHDITSQNAQSRVR